MTGPRVVLATRRFWPQVGAAETNVATLAQELKRLGASPLVLTAQVEKSWPTDVQFREFPVVRLRHAPSRLWSSYRFLGALARGLRAHRNEFDLVCASGLKYDAYTILGALAGSRVPVVLRAERGGEMGECHWQKRATFGARVRRRCHLADAIIAPSELVAGELRVAGYPADSVHLIANGVSPPAARATGSRAAARDVLAAAHPLLAAAEHAPLVVCVERFVEGSGLIELVDAWPAVMKRRREAKLWLIGQGPLAEKVWRRVERWDLKHNVILTGLFDDLAEVFQAADLLVKPTSGESSALVLLEAMAAELAIVATDTASAREALGSTDAALLVPPGNTPALSGAIIQLLADRPLAERLVVAARARVVEKFSAQRMAEQHLALFQRLLAR